MEGDARLNGMLNGELLEKVDQFKYLRSDVAASRGVEADVRQRVKEGGHGVVILDKSDYVRKMEDILNDRSKFRELVSEDPLIHTLNMENKIIYSVCKWKKDGILSTSVMMATGTQPGIMYGAPKIHKREIPLRPIISAINTCSCDLSKLAPLTINDYTLKNNYEFVKLINSVKDANNYVMCSFDIESLFTNIPLRETLEIILEQLFTNPEDIIEGFNKKQFKILLKLATTTSTFMFTDKLYEQVDGVAMGSP
ncbi:uncharacterized protein [Palaemon carinicauda]|uniref:uncharacterized protein n=1 Tax=Palaemon carinicauda TaxID=392227 RepID=UPI0035B5B6F5